MPNTALLRALNPHIIVVFERVGEGAGDDAAVHSLSLPTLQYTWHNP
jgi:hypothetical protein